MNYAEAEMKAAKLHLFMAERGYEGWVDIYEFENGEHILRWCMPKDVDQATPEVVWQAFGVCDLGKPVCLRHFLAVDLQGPRPPVLPECRADRHLVEDCGG